MTPTLRQTHRVAWLLLAIILPMGFVAALQLKPDSIVWEQPISLPLAAPLPVLVKSVENTGLQANLRREGQSTDRQLEIIVRQSLEVPSVVVRVVSRTNELAIGTLDVAGVYHFMLPDSTDHPTIILVDEVNHVVLQTIHF
ncbi:hypothetical protein [Dyadobacter arcticus]|uniref:Uncharacterized protein n=1 Tax=Dyadobacter arcticus TaxID=1078754 RepID=A0ABX0UKR4_9BACT|nr:hypothetical protein [Dyadobacter arcticus]NIJ52270.1 hypothetical protein [Dyadobacter arcticus]